MRPVIVKAYGSLHPAGQEVLPAVEAVLRDWSIVGAAEWSGDLLRLAYEGEYFPADEVVAALEPFLTPQAEGKLDVMDLEAWTLRRFVFRGGRATSRQASLNQALESCGK